MLQCSGSGQPAAGHGFDECRALQKILARNLRASAIKLGLPRTRWIFQHDNDPKHTAGSTTEWLRREKIRVLEWPACSPDLNPIEHLWDELDRQRRKLGPTCNRSLFNKLKESWYNIEPDHVLKLVNSMKRRLKAVIEARGGPTKY